ncbi:recombinase family protein [Sorangium sp. So ce233]|uniref:recombinase family protein n=1 Tax=Sorangium sp. So ce233 TaxID=3133290 RepID=UPI003F6384D4
MTTMAGSCTSIEARPTKLSSRHLDRLAVVYIRQSSVYQVQHNQESTRLQYSLEAMARGLGWQAERILTLDEDLATSGASAAGRRDFQRLLAEVALDHVGMILGVEMSRIARSNKDWHQLLELCARFGTLIADLDGLYDPSQYNDRLLLGLKGTMSEAELHILRQRLLQGKLQKARRGELSKPVPSGYLLQASGEVVLDPDESVRAVVRFIFEQFERLGNVRAVLCAMVEQGLQIGVRRRTGADRGGLEWHRPHRGMVANILRNPIYAGAYVYGRRKTDPRRQQPGRRATGRTPFVEPADWQACVRDRLPAYISWEQFERNQLRLKANRTQAASGAVRRGSALLQGLVKCGRCNVRMSVQYASCKKNGRLYPRYVCNDESAHHGGRLCTSISGPCVDRVVTALALSALTPAALEISLRVRADLEQQRAQQEALWQQRLERARYEAERAARQYRSVEPENRLVARTLERSWEDALRAERELREAYERHSQQAPQHLTAEDFTAIRALATDLPALWNAPTTTVIEHKTVLKLLIDHVIVTTENDTSWMDLIVHWVGGHQTHQRIRRPVHDLGKTGDKDALIATIYDLRRKGLTAEQIANKLNADGWITPTQQNKFNGRLIFAMLSRYGSVPRGPKPPPRNAENAWWIADLARELKMPVVTLHGWRRRGLVQARRIDGQWAVTADKVELQRLRRLRREHPPPPSRKASKKM